MKKELTDEILELEDYKTGYWFAFLAFCVACAWIVELKLDQPKIIQCFERYCVVEKMK